MSDRQIRLYAFLGNPGRQYENTRHNAGWLLLEELESRLPSPPDWKLKFKGQYAKLSLPAVHSGGIKAIGGEGLFYRSHSFMNKSGEGLKEAASFFSVAPQHIAVFYDELDLQPGKWKLQKGGGLKGHNGLRSVKQQLGSNDFYRCSLGIGRPSHSGFPVDRWVLSAFSQDDKADMARAFDEIIGEIWGL